MSIGESAPIGASVRLSVPATTPAPTSGPTLGPSAPTPLPGAVPIEPPPHPEPATSEGLAPADLDRVPALWERVAWYAGTFVFAALLIAAAFRLDETDLYAPLSYDGDTLLILPMVKATLERGSHWRNERLGYPGIQELHDFPVIDHLHFAILWAMGRVISNYVLVYNLYFLLGWPLAALTAMIALRQLRLTLPAAAVGGLLFAFMPYHFMRGEAHYFLSAYWVIPLSWLPALAVCRGEFPFFPRGADGSRRLRPFAPATLWQVLLAAATASAGAYYAFFACAIYAAAGAYSWVAQRTWRAAASAGIVIALVGVFGVVNHLPAIRYTAEYGRNSVTDRWPEEAEMYGLKVAQMLLPIDDHHLLQLAQLKSRYNTVRQTDRNENACASLGVVGSVGLLVLLGTLFLPISKRWPNGPLAALAGFMVLFALVGGFGMLFNLLLFDQVRCHNRISIYLAFICLFAVLWPVDRFLLTRTGRARRWRYPAFAALAFVGLADQTPASWFGEPIIQGMRGQADRFHQDARFYADIERQLGPSGKVFTVPFIGYPEVPSLLGINTYEPLRGYLHTNSLVWSCGAMKWREADTWQREVAHKPHDELLRRIVFRGFDGLLVDKRGFLPHEMTHRNQGDILIDDIQRDAWNGGRGVKLPMLVHEDQMQVLLDLRPYRDWLRKQDPVYFDAESQKERDWVALTWLRGFETYEPSGLENRLRWGGPSGIAQIVNPSDRPRRFRLVMTFGADSPGIYQFWIEGRTIQLLNRADGPVPWVDEFAIEKKAGDWNPGVRNFGVQQVFDIEVPPGRHTIRFRCRPPDNFMPGDSHRLCYYLKDIVFMEFK